MARTTSTSLAALALLSLVVAGCDNKTVKITFTNTLDKGVQVQLVGPQNGPDKALVVPAGGGQLDYDLEMPVAKLPATLEMEADGFNTEFTIEKETPDHVWIDITPEGISGPRETAVKHPTTCPCSK